MLSDWINAVKEMKHTITWQKHKFYLNKIFYFKVNTILYFKNTLLDGDKERNMTNTSGF